MTWRKLGLIFSPAGRHPWMNTHAQLPVPLQLDGDLYRIFFATRDRKNRSHVGYADLNLNAPGDILGVSPEPVLAPGPLGNFDDCGILPACLAKHEGKVRFYLSGWNTGQVAPMFYTSIGLAESGDGGRTFRRLFQAPIMARSEFDPCMVASPFVMRDRGIWRMWYMSCFKWLEEEESYASYYHIKYAESEDGISWNRRGLVAIDLMPGEKRITRPTIIIDNGLYRMWYSGNDGRGYRIGYAESQDGYAWTRRDGAAGIDVSPTGWDSEAVAYPFVFIHNGRKYMLYNGNSFGRDGFGLAVED